MNLAKVTSHFINRRGSDVNVFISGNESDSPDFTVKALKNVKEKTGKVVFQFLQIQNINIGDVIAQSGARDFWEVTEIEDVIVQGQFSHFAAFVEKKGNKQSISKESPSNNITYNMNGANSRVNHDLVDNSINNNTVNNSNIDQLLLELRKEILRQKADLVLENEALGVVDIIETQVSGSKPNKTVVESMINGLTTLLPHAGSLASIGSMIIAALQLLRS